MTYVYVGDQSNNRVVRRLSSDLSFVDQLATGGISVRGPRSDGTNVYIPFVGDGSVRKYSYGSMTFINSITSISNLRYMGMDKNNVFFISSTNGIYKYLKSNLSFVANIAVSSLYGVCTDNQFVYVTNSTNSDIEKRDITNLSFISSSGSFGAADGQFKDPRGISCDGTYLYIADRSNNRVCIHNCSDLSFANKLTGFNAPDDVDIDENYIYVDSTNDNWVYKYDRLTLAFISRNGGGASGSGPDQYALPYGIGSDNLLFTTVAPNPPSTISAVGGVHKNTISWSL